VGDQTRRAVSFGLAATLLAGLVTVIGAVPALASTSVISAGSILIGGSSAGTASFTLTESSVSGFANAGGTLVVTITDSANASTVHFSGTPVLSAPGSLGVTVTLGPAGTSFVITTSGADNANIAPITVSGLRISADVGAATGPIKAVISGSLVAGILSPTTTASGIIQTSVGSGPTAGVVVDVSSPCGFAPTAGLNVGVRFADSIDPRVITAATPLVAVQQTLAIDVGVSTHVAGTTITQVVADCLGTNLASPGTVGSGGSTQHFVFTTQPGGGAAGAVWAQQPVVVVENAVNMIVTGDSSTVVTLSIGTNAGGGTLSCTSGSSRTVVNGYATFSGCSISIDSVTAYTLSATSSPAWRPATSAPFTISPRTQPEVLTDGIATGVNRGTTGFVTASLVVPRGGSITLLGRTSPSLAGSVVQIWTRTKTGAWHVLTARVAATDGTIHYFAHISRWTAYQFRFAGDSTHSPAMSHGRIATTRP
jgi:hypothetical protein